MVRGKSFNTEHKLHEYKHIKPIKQKRRGLGSDRNEATCREVEELTKAGILRKRLIGRSNSSQGKEVFFYQKMPFGIKNAGATYQRLVDKVFGDQIGRNLEAYFDDMVIKSTTEEDMLQDIQETFDRFRNKGQPVKALKSCTGKNTIQWTTDAEEAFRRMKELMEILPTLTTPIKGEVLVMYLAALVESISAVLLAEREEKQVPIYFVSRVLQGVELNYPAIEKLILALVHAARRLRRYFQGQPIRVLTDAPIKQTLTSSEKSGRIAKWAIELGEHDIEFGDRSPRKTQILKDFSIKMPPEEGEKVVTRRVDAGKESLKSESIWKLYTDGASSFDGSGAGLMLISPEGREYTYALRFEFKTTNDEAEYKALLA
ncbi:reverse transcriptase domain-containing protein, partial [Tanacetum coccineum]